MLRAEANIRAIEYERTFEALFPVLMNAVNRMDGENLAVHLLQKLGESSQGVMLGILRGLSREDKDELLCRLVSSYREEICRSLNALLEAGELGGCAVVGWVDVQRESDGLKLLLGDVQVNYAKLLRVETAQQAIAEAVNQSGFGRFAKRFAAGDDGDVGKIVAGSVGAASPLANIFHGYIEKKGARAMEDEIVSRKIGDKVNEMLEQKGVYAEVSELKLSNANADKPEDKPERLLTRELEFALADAVAAYLLAREN